jgi:hypothetical protein
MTLQTGVAVMERGTMDRTCRLVLASKAPLRKNGEVHQHCIVLCTRECS